MTLFVRATPPHHWSSTALSGGEIAAGDFGDHPPLVGVGREPGRHGQGFIRPPGGLDTGLTAQPAPMAVGVEGDDPAVPPWLPGQGQKSARQPQTVEIDDDRWAGGVSQESGQPDRRVAAESERRQVVSSPAAGRHKG